jgi:hypothetical protein
VGVSDKVGLTILWGYNKGDRLGVSRSASILLSRPIEVRLEFDVRSRERYKSSPGDSEDAGEKACAIRGEVGRLIQSTGKSISTAKRRPALAGTVIVTGVPSFKSGNPST